MATINKSSIEAKVNQYLESVAGKKKCAEAVEKSGKAKQYVELAADKYIEVLKNSIATAGLSSGVVEAISNIEHGVPISEGDLTFSIDINFTNTERESLRPTEYSTVDLAKLYNNGVDHIMYPIRGYWHDNYVVSRTYIPASYFMGSAKRSFLSKYGSIFDIREVQINSDYKG